MKDVVIVSACRTAIGSFGGSLKDVSGHKVASAAMKEAIRRADVSPDVINDVRFGACMEPYQSFNIARVASIDAGVPVTSTAVTVNRACISGMEAVISGMAMIKADVAEVVLAGGVEHMSGVPYSIPKARWGCRLQNQTLEDELIETLYAGSRVQPGLEQGPVKEGPVVDMFRGKPYLMGHTAELLGQMYSISREEMDEVALRSHNNTERATREGTFREEIVPIEIPQKKGKPPILFNKDEHFIPGLTMEKLSALPPAFIPNIGKVTAGNSSGLNDAASAMIIMSDSKAKELGLKPIAKIRAVGYGGCHPSIMGMSLVSAVQNLQNKSGLGIKDFELLEVNEAFAAQYIACERELGLNREITNVNGSGIGLGHPVGCTGCRIMVTLLHGMKNQGKTLGLATLCGGGGVSIATALEMI